MDQWQEPKQELPRGTAAVLTLSPKLERSHGVVGAILHSCSHDVTLLPVQITQVTYIFSLTNNFVSQEEQQLALSSEQDFSSDNAYLPS